MYVKGGEKAVPNPNGKNGGLPHQTTIENIKPKSTNGSMQTEYKYNTPNGTKNYRYADKVEIVDEEVATIYQSGKVNKNGLPITRESKAIEDIMNSPDYNGVPIYFMPYNSNSGPIIYLP